MAAEMRFFYVKNMAVLQSIPGQYNPISQNYNTSGSIQLYGPFQNQKYGPFPNGQVLGASTSNLGAGAPPAAPASNPSQANNVNQQLQGNLGMVDQSYNDYINSLNSQQTGVQRTADTANSAIDTAAGQSRTALNNQQAQANTSYDTQATQANTQAKTATQQARDLYRQLNQQNIAQLSATGLSSSSVAEALAENLGVETARRIAGVTGSRDEVLNNIAKERTNMNSYVSQQLSDLEKQVQQQKAQIQSQLLNSIDQINSARNVAAGDRANKRQELLLNAQNASAQLDAKAQDFAQSLQTWQAQNTAKLQKTAVSFDDLASAIQASQQLAGSNFGINQQQQQANPYAGAYQLNPNQKQQDDLLNQLLPLNGQY